MPYISELEDLQNLGKEALLFGSGTAVLERDSDWSRGLESERRMSRVS